jgi:putative membrane protein
MFVPPTCLLAQQTIHGILPTRATFMLDFVFLAMFAILPVLAASLYLVKRLRRYQVHKRIQVTLSVVLLATVAAFEFDLNYITRDWRPLAEPSPYYPSGWVDYCLWIHLAFAVPTPLLWVWVIVQALRKFPKPPEPNTYSRRHARWAWLATFGMFMTAGTGWLFYWMAFVA